jgi:hypothetical protein
MQVSVGLSCRVTLLKKITDMRSVIGIAWRDNDTLEHFQELSGKELSKNLFWGSPLVSLAKKTHSGAGLKWITRLQMIQTSEEVSQFVELWLLLRQSQLVDAITWRFTSNGHYTSKSAYNMQFVGSFSDYNWAQLWSSKV